MCTRTSLIIWMRPFAQISLHCQGTVSTTSIRGLLSQLVLTHPITMYVKSCSGLICAESCVSCRLLTLSAQECVHSQAQKYGNIITLLLKAGGTTESTFSSWLYNRTKIPSVFGSSKYHSDHAANKCSRHVIRICTGHSSSGLLCTCLPWSILQRTVAKWW